MYVVTVVSDANVGDYICQNIRYMPIRYKSVMYMYTYILYIANCSRWKSYTAFMDRSVTMKLFQWNSLWNSLPWPCKKVFQQITVNYNAMHTYICIAKAKIKHTNCPTFPATDQFQATASISSEFLIILVHKYPIF